jgi:hypothetical protein
LFYTFKKIHKTKSFDRRQKAEKEKERKEREMPTVCVGGSRAASALSAAGQTAAQAYGLGAGDVGLLKGSTRPPEPPSLDPIDIMGPGAAAAETKQPKLLSYRNSMVSLMRYHESNFVREAKRYQVFPTVDYVSGDVEQLQEEGGYEQLVGVKTFRRFEDMLENGYAYAKKSPLHTQPRPVHWVARTQFTGRG